MNYDKKKLEELVKDKKVLFITTKNIDYIRNSQEIRTLENVAESVEKIFSSKENYILRVIDVWKKIKSKSIMRNEVIFVGFAPQLILPFIGYKFKNKTIIIDFFISVYDTLICDRKKFKDGGLMAKICHYLDEKTLKYAKHVITDTKAQANYFISEFHGKASIFETIYLEADSSIYYPRKQKKKEEVANKFVVLYFGSILPLQGIEVVLDTIRELKERNEIFFDIIGPIPPQFNKPIYDNVCYNEWLSQNELAIHIANADLCLAGHFNNNIEKAKRTIPGKAYIYEMMRRPIVLGDNMANHELFIEDENHHFVKMGDAHSLSKIIAKESENFFRILKENESKNNK